MTNRQWIESLTDDEFADWCCNEEIVNWSTGQSVGITPKLKTIKASYSSSFGGLKEWLKQERFNNVAETQYNDRACLHCKNLGLVLPQQEGKTDAFSRMKLPRYHQ